MRFEVDWHGTAPNVVPEERTTVADLRIVVGGRNVCEYGKRPPGGAGAEGRERADRVAVSVCPLAEEIAFNWWCLFGSRDTGLRLIDGRYGYAALDLRMTFDGADFDAVCRPYDYDNPPMRFFQESAERLTRDEAERALADFIDRVVERLDAKGLEDSSLQSRWKRVRGSRENAEESVFCEAAGAFGVDPYDISDSDADFIENAAALFSGEPLMELLSGLRRRPGAAGKRLPHEILNRIRDAENRPRHKSCLPALEDLRTALADARRTRPGERPWARGYRCAREARRRLDVAGTGRFRVRSLAARLDAPSFSATGSLPGVRAVVQSRGDSIHVHLRAARYSTGQLFALGRAVGDAVVNPPAERSAVNDLHEASRQAAGRAFAAEFLAPIDEIRSMREGNKEYRRHRGGIRCLGRVGRETDRKSGSNRVCMRTVTRFDRVAVSASSLPKPSAVLAIVHRPAVR